MRNNVGTVVRFEVGRALRSSFFWVGALLGPVLMVAFMLVSGAAGAAAGGGVSNDDMASITVAYVDESGLITADVAQAFHASVAADKVQGLRDVQTGVVDVFIQYPRDPSAQVTRIAGVDIGLAGYQTYELLAQQMMKAAAAARLGESAALSVVAGQVSSQVTLWNGDTAAMGIGQMIPLLIFPAVLLLVFFLQGNRMVIAPLEEKQNRVTEMILTTITAEALLVGKVIAVLVIGLVQMGVIGVLCVVGGMILTRTQGMALPQMGCQPTSLVLSTVILLSGFLLFTALLVAIGAAVPTEKDAQSLFSAVLMILMVPLLAMVVLLMKSPRSSIIDVLTYFPLTAAPTALLRNAVGTLTWWQGTIVVMVTLACAAVILKIAAKLFRHGSIEYNRKVSLRSALA